jgi:hypothetical protein
MGSKPKGISASRGAAVLGLSEYQTPLDVFQQIMEEREPGWNKAHGYMMPPEPDNAAIRWGTAFESAVIGLAGRAAGKRIVNREGFYAVDSDGGTPAICFDKDTHIITCHIDGWYNCPVNEYPPVLHEGKTTSAFTFREKWGTPGTDHIPEGYQVQVQHQMLCTGAEEAIVSVLVFPETPDAWEKMGMSVIRQKNGAWDLGRGGRAWSVSEIADILGFLGYFHQYPCKARPEAQRLMAGKYRAFWEEHVLTGIPPEPRTYDDVIRLFPAPKATVVIPDYIKNKIAEYKQINEETAWAKKQKERIKLIVTKYAATHGGVLDDESQEAAILRDEAGKKRAQIAKRADGAIVFRAS